MKQRKYAILLVSIVLTLILSSGVVVYAGSINGNEAGVLSKAQGPFSYKGKQYVPTKGYLGTLSAYLSRDDVDLSADQAARAIALIDANIKNAILDGVIVPADGSGGAAADGGSGATSDDGAGAPDEQNQPGKKTAEPAGAATVKKNGGNSTFLVTGANGKTVLKSSMPLKNTGFAMNGPVTVGIVLLILLIAGCTLAFKFKLFASEHVS